MREQPIAYKVGSPRAWPGPVRSTSHILMWRLLKAVSSLRSPARCAWKPPAVRLRPHARGMGACTARTCTPRETTVTHLRLQRGAPLAQQHPAQQQGLARGRGQLHERRLQRPQQQPGQPGAARAQRHRGI